MDEQLSTKRIRRSRSVELKEKKRIELLSNGTRTMRAIIDSDDGLCKASAAMNAKLREH